VVIGVRVGVRRIPVTKPPGSVSSSTWPSPAGTTGSEIMDPAVRIGILIAAVMAAGVTVTFVVLVRVFWRRGKSLRDP
jgi:hypothetical protein